MLPRARAQVTALVVEEPSEQTLRWIVSAFQNAQRQRISLGEQLRAVLQGRTAHAASPLEVTPDVAATLAEIGNGQAVDRVPVLGALYARAQRDEQELLSVVKRAVRRHPVWPWLNEVRGIGELLSARLLTLLDIERAPHPASFWAYCGLSTIPATTWYCQRCGGHQHVVGDGKPVQHRAPDGTSCAAQWRNATSAAPARIAVPPRIGDRAAPYSREAKCVCYLVGVSFTRQGTTYRRLYDEFRVRLDEMHPDWTPKRRYMGALRYTEKRFLVHLWVIWREAMGRSPVGTAYADSLAEARTMTGLGNSATGI